jgi:LCP family protein required for cell wall assembly
MENQQRRPKYIEDIRDSSPGATQHINLDRLHRQTKPDQNLSAGRFPSPSDMASNYSQPSRKSANLNSSMKNNLPPNQSGSMINSTLPNYTYGQRIGSRGGVDVKGQKKRWVSRHKVLSSFLIVVLLAIGFGGYFGSRIIGDLDKVFHGNIFSDFQALFSTARLNGEAQGRVNVLLAGYQGKQSDEGALTDSIMVVSIDTKNDTGFILSIPRDLLVKIPGAGYQKINYANTVSSFNQQGYFKGGMGQLQQILEQDFGIPIDYYALIDYQAFEDAVNAVGGITVNIQSPDPRGLYDPNVDKAHGGPLKLPNGPVHLDGLQALALALARGDSPYAYGFPKSDINREQHQRQELVALETKALSLGVLSNPVQLTRLFDAIGNNVRTDLSLSDALAMAKIIKSVNLSNIKSYGLSYGLSSSNLLTTYYSPNTGDSLIPKAGINNYTQITSFYNSIVSQENAQK